MPTDKPKKLPRIPKLPKPRSGMAIPIDERLGVRIDEFAALVGVSHMTIRRQIARGEIKIIRQAGVPIIPRRYAKPYLSAE
jgi:hypothetical protein